MLLSFKKGQKISEYYLPFSKEEKRHKNVHQLLFLLLSFEKVGKSLCPVYLFEKSNNQTIKANKKARKSLLLNTLCNVYCLPFKEYEFKQQMSKKNS